MINDANQDFSSVKSVYLNRSSQKNNLQFSQAKVAANSDTATTCTHVESFAARVCD